MMKCDIVLAGVGGQGILSIATVIGHGALQHNLLLKQAETHGMSQRGGAVQSYLRLSDSPIYSDLIPLGHADLILSVEPMEALRYLPYLSPTGVVVTSTTPFYNIPDYPELEKLKATIDDLPRVVALDGDELARQLGNVKISNMIMLGAASPFIQIPFESLEEGIRQLFGRKGEKVVALNLEALAVGRAFVEHHFPQM